MPKKIDTTIKDRAVRLVLEHRAEYPSTAKASAAVPIRKASARSRCAGG